MEKRRATNTYSGLPVLYLSLARSSSFLARAWSFPPYLLCSTISLSLSVVPHHRSFLLPRSIHVSLSRRLIPPHFSVAPRNLYVRFTIGVLRFCHCFIGESWLYNEALPLLPSFSPFLFESSLAIRYDGFTLRSYWQVSSISPNLKLDFTNVYIYIYISLTVEFLNTAT